MIGIVGAGAFGSALAVSLAQNGPVTLWGRGAAAWAETRRAPRLPGTCLPDNVTITDSLSDLGAADALLLCVPMQQLAAVLPALPPTGAPRVACCKGIELTTGRDAAQILSDHSAEPAAILTGPSFAADIARLLPTALTLACADDAAGQTLQRSLTTPNLRLYRSSDTRGAALGGALKNVIAIACGAAMGAGYGPSARAAIMTRGFAELQRYALARGAEPETLAGLSGFGDLTLTCTDAQSRNYQLGLALGQGIPFDPAITVEGAATAAALRTAPGMPITQTVAALIAGDTTTTDAMRALMARPLKEE
ncbi:MAG: NAD(P)H-dependent glycerol-3-phosphate dehydrogenase [Pseudomonadota bacterium]